MRGLAIAIVCCFALPAHAQPADPGKAAYEEGRRLYDLHKWDAAIAQFKESYRLRHDAASLFNIAQAYRLTGNCVEALAFYREYQQEFPEATNRAKVSKFIAELEPCAKQREPKPQPPKPEPPKPEPPKPEPPRPVATGELTPTVEPAPVDNGRSKRVAALAIGGAGVLAVGTGFVFGHLAATHSDQARNGTGVWDPTIEQAGKRNELIAVILWGVGGAAIVGGTVMYMLGRSQDEPPRVSIVPAHDGASLVWGCDF